MSWSFSFFAKSQTGAVNRVREEQTVSNGHFLKPAADLLVERIEALKKPTWLKDPVIRVESCGHFDENHGDAKFSVGWTELIE